MIHDHVDFIHITVISLTQVTVAAWQRSLYGTEVRFTFGLVSSSSMSDLSLTLYNVAWPGNYRMGESQSHMRYERPHMSFSSFSHLESSANNSL
jgi:hypothetical protein